MPSPVRDPVPGKRQTKGKKPMFQTIQLSSCVSVQGETVEVHGNGDVVIRSGGLLYRGRPVSHGGICYAVRDAATARVPAAALPRG